MRPMLVREDPYGFFEEPRVPLEDEVAEKLAALAASLHVPAPFAVSTG